MMWCFGMRTEMIKCSCVRVLILISFIQRNIGMRNAILHKAERTIYSARAMQRGYCSVRNVSVTSPLFNSPRVECMYLMEMKLGDENTTYILHDSHQSSIVTDVFVVQAFLVLQIQSTFNILL